MRRCLLYLSLAMVALVMVSCTSNTRLTHSTDAVYPAGGPYSQIVQTGNLFFLAGVVPLSLDGSTVSGDDIESQTRQVLDYIRIMLNSVGLEMNNVVSSTVYLTDMDEFAAMNQVYGEYFSSEPPARTTVEVSRLPRDVRIEVAVVASR